TPATPATPANIVQGLPDWASQITNTDTVAAVAQILQSPQGQQVGGYSLPLPTGNLLKQGSTALQQLVQSLQMQQQKPQPSLLQALDAGLVVQLQALTAQLTAAATANSLNPLEQRVSSFNKAMNIEGQDSIFGQENSVATAQTSTQPQLPEPESKMDDSIDNQQQVFGEVWTISKQHRSRSRSRDRKRKSSRSYSSERRAREREKERQKKGLPPIRSKTLSGNYKKLWVGAELYNCISCTCLCCFCFLVCSTTLWVGQVDKKATQQDLTNLFEEFGQIESINVSRPLPWLPL
ncbi:hypothetical protein XENOCAPTIV_015961, partial [Xenoophorus captivus]